MSGVTDGSAPPCEAELISHLQGVLSASVAADLWSLDLKPVVLLMERWFEEQGFPQPITRYGRGSSGSGSLQQEARWLVDASRADKPESAVARLRELLAKNEVEYHHVLAFWGMHPPEMVELADGIQLGPLDALPNSDPRQFFLGESLTEAERNMEDYRQRAKPRAAIVQRILLKPLYHGGPDTPAIPFTYEDKHFLTELVNVLSLVIHDKVIRVAEWSEWPSDLTLLLGSGWGRSGGPAQELPATPYDVDLARQLVSSFVGLNDQDRARLRVPLRRLNNAWHDHESFGDKAIDVGIALEALLTQPDDPREGISHRIAVRAGLLLGGGLQTRSAEIPAQAGERRCIHSAPAQHTVSILTSLGAREFPKGLAVLSRTKTRSSKCSLTVPT